MRWGKRWKERGREGRTNEGMERIKGKERERGGSTYVVYMQKKDTHVEPDSGRATACPSP
jgi:hypothetical protein